MKFICRQKICDYRWISHQHDNQNGTNRSWYWCNLVSAVTRAGQQSRKQPRTRTQGIYVENLPRLPCSENEGKRLIWKICKYIH